MIKGNKFNWKGWVSLFTLLSFVIDTVSGVILYIAPPGRVANWTDWNIWGLSKEEWGAIHTIFGYVLLIIICFHIYYNWKIFWHYIWSKIKGALNLKREMAAAVILSIVVFVGTLWDVPPFSSTMDLGAYFKDGWEENKVETPVGSVESLTLEAFAKSVNVPLDQIQKIFAEKGYKFSSPNENITKIAERNNVSPNTLYEALEKAGARPTAEKSGQGSGMGQKSIQKICEELNIPVDDAIQRLKQKGVNAKPNDRLKEIAGKQGITPMEVFNILNSK
jgi:hypothetical protein